MNATHAARLARAAERAALAAIRRARIDEVRRQARLHVASTGQRRRTRASGVATSINGDER